VKKRNILGLLLAMLMLVGLLTGCGSSGPTPKMMDTAGVSSDGMAMNSSYAGSSSSGGWSSKSEPSYAADESSYEAAPERTGGSSESSYDLTEWMPDNLKIIYTGSISLESETYDDAVSNLKSIVNDNRGWFESTRSDNGRGYRYVYYTVRIPADNFYVFCDQVGNICNVLDMQQDAQDISDMYYDIEARLATQRTKLERLQKLLEEADTMETIIQLESSISQTEYDIEKLTGSLRKYDSLVDYATVDISLREVYQITPPEESVHTFGERFAAAFKRGTTRFVEGVQNFLVNVADSWVGWLIFIIIVVVAVILIVRGSKKAKANRLARTSAPVRPVAVPPAGKSSAAVPEKPTEEHKDS
jgi:hypothetical protein